MRLATFLLLVLTASCNFDFEKQSVPAAPELFADRDEEPELDVSTDEDSSVPDGDAVVPDEDLDTDLEADAEEEADTPAETEIDEDVQDLEEELEPPTCANVGCPVDCCETQLGPVCVDTNNDEAHCGACFSPCDDGALCMDGDCCQPRSCQSEGWVCGGLEDGCGQSLDCGSCAAPLECAARGNQGLCEAPWTLPDNTPYCLTYSGQGASCPNEPDDEYFGQDGSYVFPMSTFSTSDGIVLDGLTGLHWEQVPSPTLRTYASAESYCANLSLGGISGWRIPSLLELFTIIDHGSTRSTHMDLVFEGSAGRYWSSSAMRGLGSTFYVMTDLGGTAYAESTAMVRCVHNELPSLQLISHPGWVEDLSWGLGWVTQSVGEETWKEALQECEELILDGHHDWRLPSIDELMAIMTFSPSQSPFPSAVFELASELTLWSSTPDIPGRTGVRAVVVNNGDTNFVSQHSQLHFICVRSAR
jgi:hypothetical protein